MFEMGGARTRTDDWEVSRKWIVGVCFPGVRVSSAATDEERW